MRRILLEVLAALRDIWQITFVDPVREGRPRPKGWPRGLAAIAAASLVVYALLALAATFAVNLRQAGELTASASSDHTMPTATLPLLLAGMVLSVALAHTAALHTAWWLRVVLFLLGASAAVFVIAPAFDTPVLIWTSIASYAVLLGFTLLRARRDYAWWEFVVVTVLVGVAMLAPLLGQDFASLSADLRPVALEGALTSLQVLAVPAIIVAGTAPAQIVVTGASAASSRPVGRVLFWLGAAAVAAWFAVATVLEWGSDALDSPALLGALVGLALVAVGVAVMLRRAGRSAPEPPRVYPETWSPYLYPLAITMAAPAVIILPVVVVRAVVQLAGMSESAAASALDAIWFGFFDNNPGVWWRCLAGVVVLVVAWRAAGTGRVAEAGFLVAFSVAAILDGIGLLPIAGFLHDRTPEAFATLAGGAALLAAVALAIRRRLTRRRAAAVIAVLLLAVLYPHRGLLSDPASAVLVLSAPMVILFGLTWRILTDAQFTRSGSRHFPQPTRVLLFLANSLFAVTTIAFLALARGTGTNVDTTTWADLGESMLGDSLFVIALVAGTWLAVRPPSEATGGNSATIAAVRAP